jgi:hypothetical protein
MAKAAEGGSWCPQLRILAGNTLFVGTPTSSGRFLDATEHRVAEDYWNTKRSGTSEKEAWYAESVDYAQRAMPPFGRSRVAMVAATTR